MGEPDPRHAFIVQSACDALGLPRNAADADVSGDIRRFLDDYNSGALHLAASPNGKLTRWAPGTPGDDNALAVHFVKRRPGLDVPASDVHRHILSTTLSGGEGLLLALQNVYSGDAAIEETPFIALQRSLLRGVAASSKARRSSADDDAVGDARTLTDECAFWASRR